MEAAHLFVSAIRMFIVVVLTAFTTWIMGVHLRRRIKKSLGIKVTNEMELTSLQIWLTVASAEEKDLGGGLH
jgi:hypothetical protein